MTFKNFFNYEGRQLISKRNSFLISIFLFIFVGLLLFGIFRYNRVIRDKNVFKQNNKMVMEHYTSYSQFGDDGFYIIFIPPPFMVFFDGGPVPNSMKAKVDTGEELAIIKPIKGYEAFENSSNYVNVVGLVLIFGPLLVLLYGFQGFYNHKSLKFMTCQVGSCKKLFFFLLASRMIYTFFFCCIMALLSILLFLIVGLTLNLGAIIQTFYHVFLMFACFLSIGIIGGSFKYRTNGVVFLLLAWFTLSIFLPVITEALLKNHASSIISLHESIAIKKKILHDFEQKGQEQIGGQFNESHRATDLLIGIFSYYMKTVLKMMMAQEKLLLTQMESRINFYQKIAAFSPTTFFISVSNEMSGKGYNEMVGFNKYTQKMLEDFLFYFGSYKILSKVPVNKAEPFIKGDENIYQAKISLPPNYGTGSAITYIWLLLLLIGAFYMYDRRFKTKPDTKNGEFLKVDLKDDLKPGKILLVSPLDQRTWDDFMLNIRRNEINHVVLFGSGCLPRNHKVKWIFKLFGLAVPEELRKVSGKYTHDKKELSNEKKAIIEMEIVNARVKEFQEKGEEVTIVINNILPGLDDNLFMYFWMWLEEIKKGNKVVYFSNSSFFPAKFADDWILTGNILKTSL